MGLPVEFDTRILVIGKFTRGFARSLAALSDRSLQHSRQRRCDLFTPFGVQVNAIRQRHARLPQHRNIEPHRVDDPDASRLELALDSRDICGGSRGTGDKLMGVIKSIDGQDDDFGAIRHRAGNARQRGARGLPVNSGICDMDLRAPRTQLGFQHGRPHFILGDVPAHRAMAERHDLRRSNIGRGKDEAGKNQ